MRGAAVLGLSCVLACSATTADDKTAADEPAESASSAEVAAAEARPDASSETTSGGDDAPVAAPEPVAGPFSESRVQEIVRENFGKLGDCYAKALVRQPKLAGTINVSLTIDDDGSVVSAKAPKSDAPPKPKPKPKRNRWRKPEPVEEFITDTEVVTCVEGEFKILRFPPTGRGLVTFVYPVVFRTE